MRGSRRVITFCLLTTVLPAILIVLPIYLRNTRYANVMYKISDSDVIQIHKGQSSIFCEKHSLSMNGTFNAFQMTGTPVLSDKRKHIQLKKSMTLPDDTLEYWGFYLFKGATVELRACSRHIGSKILVVKGGNTLNTCGILEGSKYNRKDPRLIENQGQVLVTLENPKSKGEITDKQRTNDEETNNILLETKNVLQNSINKHNRNREHDIDNQKIAKQPSMRRKRDIEKHNLHNPNTILDAGVHHGGNANNGTVQPDEDNSVSSFEINLHECYNGNMLINEHFPYSMQCNGTDYLENTTILKVTHEVLQDGYYYYIFYSDNDFVQNDIHVIFDIFKPTFQYVNMNESKVCLNQSECQFDIGFFSDELVIVEVPTKDGISYEENDYSILVSVCHPRMTVYVFFPVTVLLLVLLFAFL